MKKQYLISLLGLAAISIPMGNSLLDTSIKGITPIYVDNDGVTGIVIDNEASIITVSDENADGEINEGDQLSGIKFFTSYDEKIVSNFEIGNPSRSGLNIYEENNDESLFSVTYSQITEKNASIKPGQLAININSKDNAEYTNLWGFTLVDNSENLVITAEGVVNNGVLKLKTYEESLVGKVAIKIEDADSPSTLTSTNVDSTTKDSAIISYKFTPGKEVDGETNVEVNNATLYESKDGDEFTNQTDNKDGTVTIENLTPGTSYIGAWLEVEFSHSNKDDVSEMAVDEIKTKDADSPSTLTSTNVDSTTKDSAIISYEFTPGKEVDGETNVEVNNATLYESKDGDEFTNQTDNKDGTVTIENLTPGTSYIGAWLEVEFSHSNKDDVSEMAVDEIKTKDADSPSTLTSTNVDSTTKDSAIISYEFTPGKEVDGETNVEVNNATLYESKDGDEFTNQTDNKDGTVTIENLTPGTSYIGAWLEVEFSHSNKDDVSEMAVDEIKTENADVVIPTVVSSEFTKDERSAEVTYNINLGTDTQENPNAYTIESVEWQNADGSNFGNSKVITDHEDTGTLNTSDLTPGTPYEATKIVVTFEDDGVNNAETPVARFTTNPIDQVDPTFEITNTKATDTTVTFDYNATAGNDVNGFDYLLTKIVITDSTGNLVYEDENTDGMALNGSITVTGLDPNTSYDDWTMQVTFTEADDSGVSFDPEPIEIDPITTKEPKSDKLGAAAVLGIIIGVLLLVGIIIWAGNVLYKKYKDSKENIEEQEEELE